MSKQNIRSLRLHKQEISLDKEPLQNALVKREDDLKFYFCLYNLEDDFKGGFYFGLLQMHPQYPFAAPKLFVYTPNGRYETNMAICTSFTNYHQQTWTSAWNVRTLIQATISFMYADEPSYGCCKESSVIRRKYAHDSYEWNMKNELFVKLFGEKAKEIKGSNQITNESMNVRKQIIEPDTNIKQNVVILNNMAQEVELNEQLLHKNQVQNNNNRQQDQEKKRQENKKLVRKIIYGTLGILFAGGVYYFFGR